MKMTAKVADVLDGRTFVTNSGMTVILKDVVVPGLLSLDGRRAKERLEELILHQHVECDNVVDDAERHLVADVWFENQHVNELMRRLTKPAAASRPPPAATDTKPGGRKVEVEIDESAFGVKPAPPKAPPRK